MKNVFVVFPTAWDLKQLEACELAWRDRFTVLFAAPSDEDCPADFDILEFIDRSVRRGRSGLDGTFSSSDYPGAIVAAAIATALGIPGARPESVLRCSHKYASRLAQLEAVPEAVPAFALVDPEHAHVPLQWVHPIDSGFPCFVKPVKGAFSVLSRRVESQSELAEFLERPCVNEFTSDYLGLFHQLQRRYAPQLPSAHHFLAEELLQGEQVTVEGFSHRGQVEILGIVDSVMHPGTRSFARFEYPSALPAAVQERMNDIVRRTIAGIGLDNTLFNIEMTYDPAANRVAIIEINPRMCGQFADLYEKVDGTNGYEVALALATGEKPRIRHRQGNHPVAASIPLRVFEPTRLEHVPSIEEISEIERRFPGALVWVDCESGQTLCDFDSLEDGSSARYAVINLGGHDRESLQEDAELVRAQLGFDLRPLPVLGSDRAVATTTQAHIPT